VTAELIERLKDGLIVSCQARPGHPLHEPHVIGLLARCAQIGGAVAVRINGPDDIHAAKELVDVPIIGLHKLRRSGARDLITPTIRHAVDLAAAGADIIAVEATSETPGDPFALIAQIKQELRLPVMADVSTVDEGLRAWDAGAQLVGSTLSGYTAHTTSGDAGPDLALVHDLNAKAMRTIAEGRYATVQDVEAAFAAGAWSVVVGTAITDPVVITRQLVQVTPGTHQDRDSA
jgi:N-acylglucosamine-6-phosphate 2-epimerase